MYRHCITSIVHPTRQGSPTRLPPRVGVYYLVIPTPAVRKGWWGVEGEGASSKHLTSAPHVWLVELATSDRDV